MDVTLPLNLTRFLRNEMAHAPWDAAMKNLDYFRVMFDRSELYGLMQACVFKISFETIFLFFLRYLISLQWLEKMRLKD